MRTLRGKYARQHREEVFLGLESYAAYKTADDSNWLTPVTLLLLTCEDKMYHCVRERVHRLSGYDFERGQSDVIGCQATTLSEDSDVRVVKMRKWMGSKCQNKFSSKFICHWMCSFVIMLASVLDSTHAVSRLMWSSVMSGLLVPSHIDLMWSPMARPSEANHACIYTVHLSEFPLYICVCVCVLAFVYVCACVCLCMCACMCICVCTCICVYLFVNV